MSKSRLNQIKSLTLMTVIALSTLSVSIANAQNAAEEAPKARGNKEDPIFTGPDGGGEQGFLGAGNLAIGIFGIVSWVNEFAGVKRTGEVHQEALKEALAQKERLVQAEGLLTIEDRFRNLQYLNAELDAIRRNAVSRMTSELAFAHSPEIAARVNQLEAELSRQSLLISSLTVEQSDLRRASEETQTVLKRELELLRSGNLAGIKTSASSSTIQHVQGLQDQVYRNQVEAIEGQINSWNSKSVVTLEEKAAKIAQEKVTLVNKIKLKRVSFGRYAGRMGIRALEVFAIGFTVTDIGGRIYICNTLNADPTLSPTFTYLKSKLNK